MTIFRCYVPKYTCIDDYFCGIEIFVRIRKSCVAWIIMVKMRKCLRTEIADRFQDG